MLRNLKLHGIYSSNERTSIAKWWKMRFAGNVFQAQQKK
jgi:hypothetical protein